MHYFDILLFAVITGFLLIRLHRVLGRRTGHESPPPDAAPGPDAAAPAEPQAALKAEAGQEKDAEAEAKPSAADELAKGLAAIKAADPGFDLERFLKGASQAFEMIVGAFAAGDRETLERLLSEPVFRSFEASIAERERTGEVMEVRDIKVANATYESARMEEARAVIRVEFESEKVEVVRSADGAVVDGDPDIPARANDLWTFARDVKAADPNWTLIRTGE